jgi:hypothetical protein
VDTDQCGVRPPSEILVTGSLLLTIPVIGFIAMLAGVNAGLFWHRPFDRESIVTLWK